MYAIVELAKKKGVKNVYVHAFLDGRDVPPTSGKDFVEECANKLKEIGLGKIATVMGRYYAMEIPSYSSTSDLTEQEKLLVLSLTLSSRDLRERMASSH